MKLTIKDKEYELKFGFKFLNFLDEKYKTKDLANQDFGIGMEVIIPRLLIFDSKTLAEVIFAGCKACDKAPAIIDIYEYLEEVDDIEGLHKEVLEELKKANATKLRVTRLLEEIEQEKEAE